MRIKLLLPACLLLFVQISIFAQTHLPVPLGDPVYYMLETAQMRGLCGFLPGAKPYSSNQIINYIDIILANEIEGKGALTKEERALFEEHKARLSPKREGLDLIRGVHAGETTLRDIYMSWELGFGFNFDFSAAYYAKAGGYNDKNDEWLVTPVPADPDATPPIEGVEGVRNYFRYADHVDKGDFIGSYDSTLYVHFKGDLGRRASYGLGLGFKILSAERSILGITEDQYAWDAYNDNRRDIVVYSEPLAYFPYSYKKGWDAHLYQTSGLSAESQLVWPQGQSLGYKMIPEFAGALLNDHVYYRISRMDREWGAGTVNSGLFLNQSAQPFLGAEITITPFTWMTISSITGTMEFHQSDLTKPSNEAELKKAAEVSQNMFSAVMLEVNYKGYFKIDVGSVGIYPKRTELAYLFPFADNFISQNSLGDFDNMALFLNFHGQYPGIGKIWASAFFDEFNPLAGEFFTKDRNMYAFQVGGAVHIQWLSFTSVTFSYTKVEPYTYTHNRIETPWYNSDVMEQNYINFGRNLGHYLPPNSDEFLIRFETMPIPQAKIGVQYQLIRRGADYGDRQVDGSNIWQELATGDGNKRSNYKKYFLRDGAYQWTHVLKLSGEYSFTDKKWPFKAYAETGFVYSYFTDIDSSIDPKDQKDVKQRPFSIVKNDPRYPHQLYFIASIGVRIFPKF